MLLVSGGMDFKLLCRIIVVANVHVCVGCVGCVVLCVALWVSGAFRFRVSSSRCVVRVFGVGFEWRPKTFEYFLNVCCFIFDFVSSFAFARFWWFCAICRLKAIWVDT